MVTMDFHTQLTSRSCITSLNTGHNAEKFPYLHFTLAYEIEYLDYVVLVVSPKSYSLFNI